MDSERHHRQFISRYQVIEELGSGSVGVVYRAYDPNLKKTVAVKALIQSQITDAALMRFQKEAKALKKLHHASIPEVYNFAVTESGEPYLVMEYVEGTSLRKLIEKGPLEYGDTLFIIESVCDALAYAHGHGVVHRDVKPENIRLDVTSDRHQDVKVIDFGVAQVEDPSGELDMTKSGRIIGSPAYMSPEQIRGLEVDGRSDVYSLGCVLYEMLTGLKPFEGTAPMATALMQVSQPAPKLSDRNGSQSYSQPLEAAMQKCLTKNADERFQSMNELKEHLRSVLLTDIENSAAPHTVPNPVALKNAIKFSADSQPAARAAVLVAIAVVVGLVVVFLVTKIFSDLRVGPTDAIQKSKALPPSISETMETLEKAGWPIFAVQGITYHTAAPGATDESFKKLAQLPDVENVRIPLSNVITGEGFRYLQNKPIKRFMIISSKLDDKGVENLCKIKSLESVNIELSKTLSNEGIKHLLELPNLESVNYGHIRLPSQTFKITSQIPKLVHVGMRGVYNLKHEDIPLLAQLPRLTSITMRESEILDQDCQTFASFKHLEDLELRGNRISDVGCRILAKMPLKRLELSDNPITDDGILALCNAKDLVFFNMAGLKVSDSAIKAFVKSHPQCELVTTESQSEDEFGHGTD